MRLCYKFQRRVCSKKQEDISIIKNREREGTRVCKELVEKEIYSTIEITTNVTSVLYAEKG